MSDGQTPAPAPSKGMNPILKWLLIGCGTLMMLVVASCVLVTYACKRAVNQMQADLEAKGVKVDTSHGLTGTMTSVAGAAMGKGAALAVAQAIPSLPPEEQEQAKQVALTLAEKGSRMSQQDIQDFNVAMQRYQTAVEPQRKARHEAMWNEQDPTKKAQLAQEALKVDPQDARQLVADLKVIADRIK